MVLLLLVLLVLFVCVGGVGGGGFDEHGGGGGDVDVNEGNGFWSVTVLKKICPVCCCLLPASRDSFFATSECHSYGGTICSIRLISEDSYVKK